MGKEKKKLSLELSEKNPGIPWDVFIQIGFGRWGKYLLYPTSLPTPASLQVCHPLSYLSMLGCGTREPSNTSMMRVQKQKGDVSVHVCIEESHRVPLLCCPQCPPCQFSRTFDLRCSSDIQGGGGGGGSFYKQFHLSVIP